MRDLDDALGERPGLGGAPARPCVRSAWSTSIIQRHFDVDDRGADAANTYVRESTPAPPRVRRCVRPAFRARVHENTFVRRAGYSTADARLSAIHADRGEGEGPMTPSACRSSCEEDQDCGAIGFDGEQGYLAPCTRCAPLAEDAACASTDTSNATVEATVAAE